MTANKPLIIYHANCPDGFTAAWVARRYFRERGVEPEFLPASYGDRPPDVAGREVYVLDFSYPRAVLERMHSKAGFLLVLDHHQTAKEDLDGLPFARFDLDRSGAGLAWDYFFEGPRPWLVNFVEDRDLWRWKYPTTRAVCAVLDASPKTFEAWDEVHERLDVGTENRALVREGEAILSYQDALVERIAGAAMPFTKEVIHPPAPEQRVIAVNTSVLQSEVTARLYADFPTAAVFAWYESDRGIVVSFRSAPRVGPDVSRLAKHFGGGGHPHAAGCVVSPTDWSVSAFATECLNLLEGSW